VSAAGSLPTSVSTLLGLLGGARLPAPAIAFPAGLGRPNPTRSPPVDELLALISTTGERGIDADAVTRARIEPLMRACEAFYAGSDPLTDGDRLYQPCDVIYVGQTDSKAANAAGGQFRGALGRRVFQTKTLRQDIVRGEKGVAAVNHLSFRLLGLFNGDVVLFGSCQREGAESREALRKEWGRELGVGTVRADFDSPHIRIGPLHLRIGPSSTVRLDTTYLDDTVRISRGGKSGTAFVFRRVGSATGLPLAAGLSPAALAGPIVQEAISYATARAARDSWRAALGDERRTVNARALGKALLALAVVATAAPALPSWLVGLPLALFGGALLRSSGGIVVDRPRPATSAAQ